MLLWTGDDLAVLEDGLTHAREGVPRGLLVEGEPGMGKSSWLDELHRRARDFEVLLAEGAEGPAAPAPFGVLRQWGIPVPRPGDGGSVEPFVAAQGIRRLLDQLGGPVVLACDDLQWCDAESVEALTWLLRRAAGDQLLVATAARPLASTLHAGWQRWVGASDHGARVRLDGLSLDHAIELAAGRHTHASPDQIEALWRHTGGNPLYLQELLTESDLAELVARRVLPAPAEFSRAVTGRLARLPGASIRLLEAAAVLSSGWCSLADLGVLAGVADPAAQIDPALAEGLLSLRDSGVASVRLRHTLVRSAVYGGIPMARRQALHRRAAEITMDRATALEHRVAASDGVDDDLADELASYAARQHALRAHRVAARFLRWSSEVTADRAARRRRWLASLFDSVLARDLAVVHAAVPTLLDVAESDPAAALVLGALAVLERREHEGIAVLSGLLSASDVDSLTRYRAEVLQAWAQIAAGEDPAVIQRGIERFQSLPDTDPALAGFAVLTAGGNAVRVRGIESVLSELESLPKAPRLVPAERTFELAWRGSLSCRLGYFADAVADLSEVTRRIQEGTADFSGGVFHAFLARAQWMEGDWPHSQLNFRLAEEIAVEAPHPLTMAMAPIADAVSGRESQAAARLRRAELVLQARPWQDQAELLLVTAVVVAHASPDDAVRRGLLDRMRRTGYDPDRVTRRTTPWLLHAGWAGVWAGDAAYVRSCRDELAAVPAAPPWATAARWWLDGLAAGLEGRPEAAVAALDSATADADALMPLYRSHLWRDRARAAEAVGQDGRRWRERADAGYRALGAGGYLTALDEAAPRTEQRPAAAFGLSERERDVLTLVLAGMSYAQIGGELFITRKTVGYHLGNMYAKCGVTSRHELADSARRQPALFGLR